MISFAALFITGKYSPEYNPDPIIEGRKLSAWAGDLKSSVWQDQAHEKAVAVLQAYKDEIKPALLQWFAETDSVPQIIYLGTMSLLEGKTRDLLDYRGAYFNQLAATRAFQAIGESGPDITSALQRVIDQYEGNHRAAETAAKALEKLNASH